MSSAAAIVLVGCGGSGTVRDGDDAAAPSADGTVDRASTGGDAGVRDASGTDAVGIIDAAIGDTGGDDARVSDASSGPDGGAHLGDAAGPDGPLGSDAAPDGPSVVCGDGHVEGDEICDDGNTVTESDCAYGMSFCEACDARCAQQLQLVGRYCGDGIVDPEEACDDGAENSDDWSLAGHCNADCTATAPFCGDGVVDPGNEQCAVPGPYCTEECRLTSGAVRFATHVHDDDDINWQLVPATCTHGVSATPPVTSACSCTHTFSKGPGPPLLL